MNPAAPMEFTIRDIRIQPLGPCLVRIEQRGPKGFEDRETFTVCDRGFPGAAAEWTQASGAVGVATANYRVVVPEGTRGLAGVRIESGTGEPLCVLSNALLAKKDLPTPGALPAVWVLGDAPRVVPPARGALPPPAGEEDPASGWDLANDAPDAYVFFPAASGYEAFRANFLKLTGAVPLVPLYALGLWYSRYHPYDEAGALAVIDRFRAAGIPLDLFTLDTDWRVGASCGYAINEKLFPDLGRFIRQAHDRHVRVMLNDHPEPKGNSALDPEELRFRQQGLASILALGADLWWFDRNWHTCLQAPAPGLEKEVWGMRLYRDVTQNFHPERRPLILSNADGINNGRRDAPAHPAAHRFPVWWTGDTVAEWRYLEWGVRNAVDSGIVSLLPYVHEDLGGHHGQPDAEFYTRFMQFGAFSPVARIHSTAGVHRYPWKYGAPAERTVGDCFRLRYRLLPLLYAAAHATHRTGAPLLRRCDLEWPGVPEAADSTQYLLGDDLLVAPILAPARPGGNAERTVWLPPGEWQDPWTGRTWRGPLTLGVECPLAEVPIFVRGGGLVFSIPQRQWTGAATWPELVVDAFAPGADGESTRWLEEDDGWSTAHERGECARTRVRLVRRGNQVVLALEPAEAPAGIRPARRQLVVRFHLPAGTGAAVVARDGGSPETDSVRVLPPVGGRAPGLFTAPGQPPAGEAGPVVEWRGNTAGARPVELRVEMR